MDFEMLQRVKIVVEQHPDGYVAYPLGVKGAVVGEGATADEALSDARSALRFHIESFGDDVFDASPVLDAFVAEDTVTLG
jgi:hypothetical protein